MVVLVNVFYLLVALSIVAEQDDTPLAPIGPIAPPIPQEPSNAEVRDPLLPDHVVSQVGGYVGFSTIGVGYDIGEYYRADAILGFVPRLIGGEDLWSLSLKNSIMIHKFDVGYGAITPYVGITLLYSFDDDTYLKLPDQYPRKYYPSTALRTSPYIGVEWRKRDWATYFEFASLDQYLETYVRSDGELNYWEIITYSIGYRRFLN